VSCIISKTSTRIIYSGFIVDGLLKKWRKRLTMLVLRRSRLFTTNEEKLLVINRDDYCYSVVQEIYTLIRKSCNYKRELIFCDDSYSMKSKEMVWI